MSVIIAYTGIASNKFNNKLGSITNPKASLKLMGVPVNCNTSMVAVWTSAVPITVVRNIEITGTCQNLRRNQYEKPAIVTNKGM